MSDEVGIPAVTEQLNKLEVNTKADFIDRFVLRQLAINVAVAKLIVPLARGNRPTVSDSQELLDAIAVMLGESAEAVAKLAGERQ